MRRSPRMGDPYAVGLLIAFLLLCFIVILAMNLLLVSDSNVDSGLPIKEEISAPVELGPPSGEIRFDHGLFHLDIFRRKIRN